MSINAGPDSIENGLVFSFDAANPKCYNPAENLITFSEQLTHANWTAIGTIPATANAALAPDGTLTGNKLVLGNGLALNSSALGQNPTKPAIATPYTFSVYVKAAEFNMTRILLRDNANNSNSVDCAVYLSNGTFNYTASAVGTFNSANSTITPANNGWYRVALTTVTGTETTLRAQVYVYDSVASAGNGTSGIYVWGAQLERNAVAGAYTRTTSTAVAKATTTVDISGQVANGAVFNAPSFNPSNGGSLRFGLTTPNQYIQTNFTQPAQQANTDFTWSVWMNPGVNSTAGAVGNRYFSSVMLYDFTKLDQNMSFEYFHPTSTVISPGTITYGSWYHACIVKNQSTITYYLNNVAVASNTSIPIPQANTLPQKLWIGGDGDAGEICNNAIVAKVDVYNRALTPSEVAVNFNSHRNRFGI